jgi:general secretion pathway protein B
MSFILDALKKSESERQQQAGPALFEVRVAPPRAGLPIWAVVAGIALGVAAATIAVLLWRGSARSDTDTAAASGTAAAPAAGVAGDAVAGISSAAPLTSAATSAATIPNANTPAAGSTSAATPPTASRFNPPLVDDPASDTSADADETAADRMPALPAGSGAMNGPAAPAAANGRSHSTGLPSRDDLIASGQAQIPDVQLNLHVYDSKPAARFVIVNGQRAHEGEVLANGVRVDEVTSDGAVLSFRGARFLLPIP